MSIAVKAALDHVLRRYVDHCQHITGALPTQDHDPKWPSESEIGEPNADGTIHWRPRERNAAADFSGLESALDVDIHPDIKSFYGSYWGASIEMQAAEGGVTLIQVWNSADFDRLGENIIGHAMAKQRMKAPLTVFIGCTDEEEYMLSVENESGRVVLEEPGSPPTREVSPSLVEFLERLQPIADPGDDQISGC